MSTGAKEIDTINRAAVQGSSMVARVVISSSVYFVRLSGTVAKDFFAAVVHSEKTAGKENLAKLLKTGEPLELYTFTEDKMKLFANEAKKYGIVYSVVKRDAADEKQGIYDVMVKKSDAGKLSRVLDKIGYANVEVVEAEPIKEEVNSSKEQDGVSMTPKESRRLVDLMLQPDERGKDQSLNPELTAEREYLSAGISPEKRPSVEKKMEDIKMHMNEASDTQNMINQMLSSDDSEEKIAGNIYSELVNNDKAKEGGNVL